MALVKHKSILIDLSKYHYKACFFPLVPAANFGYSVLPTTFFERNEEECRCFALVMGVAPVQWLNDKVKVTILLKTFKEVGDVVRSIKIYMYINLLRGTRENRLMELRIKATGNWLCSTSHLLTHWST